MAQAISKKNGCFFYEARFIGPIKPEHCKDLFESLKAIPAQEFHEQKILEI